jgi:hypothetical protein
MCTNAFTRTHEWCSVPTEATIKPDGNDCNTTPGLATLLCNAAGTRGEHRRVFRSTTGLEHGHSSLQNSCDTFCVRIRRKCKDTQPYLNQSRRPGMNIMHIFPQSFQCVKMAVFWVAAPCSPVEVCRRFRGVWSKHPKNSSNPDDSHLHTRCRENLISHLVYKLTTRSW